MQTTLTAPTLGKAHFVPVREELDTTALPVRGEIPAALEGLFVRIGPNPRRPGRHLFFGEGMLHGVWLGGGRARRYANRYVRSALLERDELEVVDCHDRVDLHASPANTTVVAHGGRLFALYERGLPYEIDYGLNTVGVYDYGGRVKTAMSAHPKLCPATGELFSFGYAASPHGPALTYYRADATGALVESREIAVRGRTLMHDLALTERHVVFLDFPLVFDLELARRGEMPYRFSDTYGARLGVMAREGDGSVRWFEVEPCFAFHVLNAYDRDGRIVLDVVRYPELWRHDSLGFDPARLHRWTVDPAAGTVRETPLDDEPVEFPRCDDRLTGRPHRFGYVRTTGELNPAPHSTHRPDTIVKHDLLAGTTLRRELGAGRLPGESVFVPASPGAGEDEGWLLNYVFDLARDASDLVILDARDLSTTAVVTLPQRVPYGFHASWIPAPQG